MSNTIYTKTHITVLKGNIPSRKVYNIKDNVVENVKSQHPYKHDYVTHYVNNIEELYDVIKKTSTDDHAFIIRGKGPFEQDWDVTRLKLNDKGEGTFFEHPTAWLCVDFDKEEVPPTIHRTSKEAIEWLIHNRLPEEFHNASYVYQWSVSSGLEYNNRPVKRGTNVHLFFYLSSALTEGELKGWFGEIPGKFDMSVFQVNQPIYVNDNCIKDDRIIDTIPRDEKIGLILKSVPVVTAPSEIVLSSYRDRYSKATTIDVDSADAIIQKLNEVGCIVGQSINTYSLKSPNEKSQGGYYIKKDNPIWVGHGGKGSKRVDQWLMDEWGVEFKLPQQPFVPIEVKDEMISLVNNFKNRLKNKPEKPATIEDAFEVAEPLFVEAYPRDKRHKMTYEAYKQWMRQKDNTQMLLYAFEGFGKSRIVHILVEDRKKVLVACKTNEQAIEMGKNFKKQGLQVQVLTSREYLFKQQGLEDCIVKRPKRHPWDAGEIDKSATKNRLKNRQYTDEDIEKLWMDTETAEMDFVNNDVVVMTHTRLALYGYLQEMDRRKKTKHGAVFDYEPKIPERVVCIWDDVDRKDFALLTPYDNQYANVEINGKLIEVKSFTKVAKNKQTYEVHYFIKPEAFRYGFGIGNRQIYSTTEELTSMLIEKEVGVENLFVPKLMPDQKMKAGDITVFKTKMTGRNNDGLLLPIFQRAKKEGFDFYAIGDSISPLNHTNNKGQNCYDDKDILVEVSQMNMMDIPLWLDELGWDETMIPLLKIVDALDRLHQAIGRNSGYRWADKPDADKRSAVVLMDAGIFKDVCRLSRYYFDHTEDLDNPNYSTYKKRQRDCLGDCIAWYIQNLDAYINSSQSGRGGDRKMFQRDCQFVVENYDKKFIERMFTALENYVKTTKNIASKKVIKEVIDEIGKTCNRLIYNEIK